MTLTGEPGFMHGSVSSLGPIANASLTSTQWIRHSPRAFAATGILLGECSSNSPSSICSKICFRMQVSVYKICISFKNLFKLFVSIFHSFPHVLGRLYNGLLIFCNFEGRRTILFQRLTHNTCTLLPYLIPDSLVLCLPLFMCSMT